MEGAWYWVGPTGMHRRASQVYGYKSMGEDRVGDYRVTWVDGCDDRKEFCWW